MSRQERRGGEKMERREERRREGKEEMRGEGGERREEGEERHIPSDIIHMAYVVCA